MDKRLNTELLKIKENGLYPFHMPGHKRNADKVKSGDFGSELERMYDIDITEIDNFDNLHDASGIIKDAQERAAKLYGSNETHFLVNGSSGGILAAIAAVTDCSDKIIVARNCHVSVYNAIELNGLKPVFVYPEIIKKDTLGICSSISIRDIEKTILDNTDAKAVVITSPTYDGILSDVAGIAKLCHEFDMPLIVDEAHGALFFMEGRSAVRNGADIVINSVHKTLPALTQTALIHINGQIVDRDRVRKYLRMYQTSSPSYILMGSIDYAVMIMEEKGKALYRDFCIRTVKLKEALSKLRYLEYIDSDSLIKNGAFDFDESKILIASGTSGLTGREIYRILREKYSLQPEMAAGNYVLLMTTLFDTDEGIERLISALFEMDRRNDDSSHDYIQHEEHDEDVHIKEISGQAWKPSPYTVYLYPPGIPVIVKGETLTENVLTEIKDSLNAGLDVKFID